VRASRAAGISVLPGLRAAGHTQRGPVSVVDGAVASGPRLAAVHVATVDVTHGRSAAATRVHALGLLVCASASAGPAVRPAAVAGATGQRTSAVTRGPVGVARSADRVRVPAATGRYATAARRPGCDAGGWPGSGAVW
jgi:hypothetical protein